MQYSTYRLKYTEMLKNKYPNASIIHLKEPKKNKEELNKISE